jgi:ATP-dependent Clp protease adaptor protein ClpS
MSEMTSKLLPRHETRTKVRLLPRYRVLLHNDDVNDMVYVVCTIMELVNLNQVEATQRMFEAHHKGIALLLITHKERAELLMDQFASKGLTVTIEPEET